MTHAQKRALRAEVVEKAKAGSSLSELASAYPLFSPEYIRIFCGSAGISFRRENAIVIQPLGENDGFRQPSSRWDNVDWDKRDTDIAEELGVTRERVRQVRRRAGRPDSKYMHQYPKPIAFMQWAEQNLELLKGKTASEIAECEESMGLSAYKIAQLLRRIGIEPKIEKTVTIEEILESKTVDPETGCWHCGLRPIPNGHIRMPGTGQYDQKRGICNKVKYVRNVAFEKLKGIYVPRGMYLANTCGDITCINPDHQKIATWQDMMQGVDRSQMTFAERNEIVEMYRSGSSVSEIVAKTGRSRQSVQKILKNRMYREIESVRLQVRECVARNPGSSLERLNRLLDEVPRGMLSEIVWAENRAGHITSHNYLFYPKKKEVRIELPIIQ